MPINIHAEDILSLAAAADVCPPVDGKQPNPSTIWRWVRVGLKTPMGHRVRLEHARIGYRVVTSREALQRFATTLADADREADERRQSTEPRSPYQPRTAKRRQADVEKAERELAEMGL